MTEGTMNGIIPTMPMTPASSSTDAMGGMGNWMWIIIIFLLLGNNGNGLFGNNNGVAANGATNLINNDFLYSQQKIDNLGQALINQTTALNQTINSGFNGVSMGMCNLGHQIDSGFCGVNRNIDSVKFEAAQNTCAITTAIAASTQAIKDLINGNTMQDLRDRNGELSNALNNSVQTQNIINQLRPYPTPTYITAPPGLPFGYAGVPMNNPCNQY